MRCSAIGAALEGYGWQVVSAQRDVPAGDAAIALSGAPTDEPAELARQLPEGCDLLVVDHYRRDRAFEAACRPWARQILAIDDLCDRVHDADLLLDPMPGRQRSDYRVPLQPATETLLGAGYAPLRASFARHRHQRNNPNPNAIFVGFGGTDPTGLTRRTLDAVRASKAGEQITAVVGPGVAGVVEMQNAHLATRIVVDPPDIAATMAECATAIGAGGVSSLERCVLGLPSVAVIAVDNQRETVGALTQRGAVVPVSDRGGEAFAADIVAALETMRERRAALGQAAAAVCDGLGAVRVAARLTGPALRDGTRLRFRPVTPADADTLLSWQHLPEIRRFSRNPQPPERATHIAWLARKLADPTCVFEIAQRGDQPVGVLRLDRVADARYEVSIYVLPQAQGLGAGKAMLDFARHALPWATLIAEVLPGNEVSHRLFRSSGYRHDGTRYQHAPIRVLS